MLQALGIVVGKNNKASAIFEKLFSDFMEIEYNKPSEYIRKQWAQYKENYSGNANLNGKIFEYILASLFIREKILPLYMQAKVAFVPNVDFDLMFYTRERGPICISAKTSLRERYKQADLESIALKYVHRKALSFLVTLSDEAYGVREKIKTGDVIGLDDAVMADMSDFDDLIYKLKQYDLEEPPTVNVIESTQIVTERKVIDYFKSEDT